MPMVAIIFGIASEGSDRTDVPATTRAQARVTASGRMNGRSDVMRIHQTPAAAYAVQATDTPQMLRDVDPPRSHQDVQDVPARTTPRLIHLQDSDSGRAGGLLQFPAMSDPKSGAELCWISSGIRASGNHQKQNADALRRIARSADNPRKKPVVERDTVSMLVKICGL
jgi:hypothetical protein